MKPLESLINFQSKYSKNWKKLVGEIFKQKGLITSEQLQTALNLQKDILNEFGRSIRLGMIIVEQEFAKENELVKAINDYYDLSITSLAENFDELLKKKREFFIEKLPAPRIPIWLRLSMATTVIIIFIMSFLSFIILNRQKERLFEQSVKIGTISLNYFVNNARIPLLESNVLRLNTLINEATSTDGILYAIIVDNNNNTSAHTDHRKIGTAFEAFLNMETITKKDKISYFKHLTSSKIHALNLTRPVFFKNTKLGDIHVGVSLDFIDKVISKERREIIYMTIFFVIIGLIWAVFIGFSFSKPISNLVNATTQIRKKNYRYKVDLKRNDELGNLAKAFNHMSEELWMNSLVQESFGKYVGPEVLSMIVAHPESAWLKGHKNEAAVVFTDIRGFTAYSGSKEPEEVVESLNEYFDIATQAILKHGGYIDKFIGDAVLGVFGVPVHHDDYIKRAVKSSIEMQEKLKKASKNGNILLSSVGIGIKSGIVVAGNIGSQSKMEYTVIGDTVNVASRLNGIAGPGEIIIGSKTYNVVKDLITAEALPPRKIKGKSNLVETFKILGLKGETDETS